MSRAETNNRRKVNMRALRILLCTIAMAAAPAEGAYRQTTVAVTELPPEVIPVGTCTESTSGFLGVVEKDKKERTNLTAEEIGKYVTKSLAQGYSVTLYPQASGKIFTVATCHPTNPKAAE
jgi:hypothetical protein